MRGSRQCSRTRGSSGGMISSTLLPFRANGTSRDDITLFIAVVTELLGTIPSNIDRPLPSDRKSVSNSTVTSQPSSLD